MTFPPSLLNDNEDVVLDLRPNWSTLVKPVLAVVVSVVVTGLFASAHIGRRSLVLVGLVLMAGAVTWFLRCYARWNTTNFVVTTDRLIYRSGLVAKHGKEIPLDRVTNIAFGQTFFERLLGTGDLTVESAGVDSRAPFEDIPHPSSVQNEIYRQMEALADRRADRSADRMAGHRELSVPEQLEKLDELRQRGIVTQAEFDVKKQQLLDRM